MSNVNTLPFQYALRGDHLSDESTTAAHHEQRDRDLEDFLAQLAAWVGYTPAAGGTAPWAGGSSYFYGICTGPGQGVNLPANAETYLSWAQVFASGISVAGGNLTFALSGRYLVQVQVGFYASNGAIPRTDVYVEQRNGANAVVANRRVCGNSGAGTGYNFESVGGAVLDVTAGDFLLVGVAPTAANMQIDFGGACTWIEVVPVGGAKGDPGPQGIQGIPGPTGPQGPAGGSSGSYRHVQASASTTWTVAHNLGYRPNVTAVDSAGTEILPGAMTYPDANTVILTFSAAVGGEAYAT